ncbi:MAG: type II toxin-antitoxin system HicA family toxin [Deltaproteobacteria bacterium]|nr:type II toxin-antitoxin system HicA family toxin [Deltaproteobacteria bacterium]
MINKLKNTPIRDLIRALEQDGFQYTRRKGSQRVYRPP